MSKFKKYVYSQNTISDVLTLIDKAKVVQTNLGEIAIYDAEDVKLLRAALNEGWEHIEVIPVEAANETN